jgi:hypothetical protein
MTFCLTLNDSVKVAVKQAGKLIFNKDPVKYNGNTQVKSERN